MSKHKSLILLGCILAAAIGIRGYHLTLRSLWFDETFSLELATGFSWWEMIERTGRDVHPPGYYILLRLWVALFGTSVLALRSLSVLFAGVTISAVYLFCVSSHRGRDQKNDCRQGRLAGLYSAALLAVASYHIQWSRETRMYTLGTALAVISTICLFHALQSRHVVRWWIAYVASAAAFLYTHNYALFTVFGQSCFLLGHFLCQHRGRFFTMAVSTPFLRATTAFAAVGWLYLPWVPVLLEQKRRVQADYWISAISPWSVPDAWNLMLLPRNYHAVNSHWVSLAVVLSLALILLVYLLKEPGVIGWLVTAMAVVPVICAAAVSIISVSVIVPRHFLYSQPFILIATGTILATIRSRAVGALIFTMLMCDGLCVHALYERELNVERAPGVRGAAEFANARREPADRYVVLHPCIYHPVCYYADSGTHPKLYGDLEQTAHYTGRPILVHDDFVGASELTSKDVKRLWVFDTTGFNAGFSGRLLPIGWEPTDTMKSFREPYFFQGVVTVTLYQPSPHDSNHNANDKAAE